MPKLDPSALLAISRAAQREAVVEAVDTVAAQSRKEESSERRAAWANAMELAKESVGSHVLLNKEGKGSRPIIATSLKNDRGHRLVLIPYNATELRTARKVGMVVLKGGEIRVRGNYHEQWVRPERIKKAA